jgi:hypothetical protein
MDHLLNGRGDVPLAAAGDMSDRRLPSPLELARPRVREKLKENFGEFRFFARDDSGSRENRTSDCLKPAERRSIGARSSIYRRRSSWQSMPKSRLLSGA